MARMEDKRERDWAALPVYSLGFLTLISTFNYLDRSLLGLALPQIKREMQVSDTVLGLVSGLAFVLFYSILGIPIAWAADRFSRRNIIAVGLVDILAGGLLIDRFGRERPRLRARIPAIACWIAGPSEALFLLSDRAPLWMTAFALSSFFTLIHQGPVFALGMSVVRVPMRAFATSIMLFSSALLGQVVGPLIVGVLNDAMAPAFGDQAIRYSLLVVAATSVVGGCMFWLAGNHLEADSRRAAEG